jgi:hypothetical protein
LVAGENAAADFFPICSSVNPANRLKPISLGINSSQSGIAFGGA